MHLSFMPQLVGVPQSTGRVILSWVTLVPRQDKKKKFGHAHIIAMWLIQSAGKEKHVNNLAKTKQKSIYYLRLSVPRKCNGCDQRFMKAKKFSEEWKWFLSIIAHSYYSRFSRLLARVNERVNIHNKKYSDKLSSIAEIKIHFPLNEHGDLYFLLLNNSVHIIFFNLKTFKKIFIGTEKRYIMWKRAKKGTLECKLLPQKQRQHERFTSTSFSVVCFFDKFPMILFHMLGTFYLSGFGATAKYNLDRRITRVISTSTAINCLREARRIS